MGGPVKKSPAEIARLEVSKGSQNQEEALDMTIVPGTLLTPEAAAVLHQPLKLIEKFALQMGGVEPEKMLATLKATAFRLPDKNFGGNWTPQEVTNEQMMALLVVANKYGLNPFIKEIYAFPDKGGIVPIVGVDGWSRMINDHDQFDGMKFMFDERVEEYDHAKRCPVACTCIIYRKDRTHPTEVTEYLDEVYRPPFVKQNEVKAGPWQSHTKRMLRHKAMIQCARIAFGFTGIHDDDEGERIVAGSYVIPNDKPTQAQSLSDRFKTAADHVDDDVDAVLRCDHVWLLDPMTKLGDTVRCRDCPETKIYEPPIEGEVITKEEAPAGAEETAPAHHGTTAPEPKPEPEPKSEPEKKPAAKKTQTKKAPAKKPAPKPVADQTAKFMDRIIEATNKDDVTKILTEVADAKGMSAPKRAVLKKTAEVKVKEFDDGE